MATKPYFTLAPVPNKAPGKAALKASLATFNTSSPHRQDPTQLQLFDAFHYAVVDPAAGGIADTVERHINEATSMRRFAILDPRTVFNHLANQTSDSGQYERWNILGVDAMATPKRIRSFKDNLTCVCCGRIGNVFLVERHNNDPHAQYLNLYAVDEHGLVLMTVDHILPDSLGGKYDSKNFQTMCRACNGAKGMLMSADDIKRVRANMRLHAKGWMNLEFLSMLLDIQEMINKASAGSKEYADLMKIFDQFRRRIKFNSKPNQIAGAVADLKRAIHEHRFGPTPVVVPIVKKPPMMVTFKKWWKATKRRVRRKTAYRIRCAGEALVKYSVELMK